MMLDHNIVTGHGKEHTPISGDLKIIKSLGNPIVEFECLRNELIEHASSNH